MRTIVVMAKAPLPGVAKTRLAAEVGAERAARIAAAMFLDTLDACSTVDAELVVAFAPFEERSWFEQHAPRARRVPQVSGDLSARLQAATVDAFARGSERLVFVGTDAPELAPADLERAFASLATHDVVLGPSFDGGFWLVGLARCMPELFLGIPWSTERTFAATRARAVELGLSVGELDLRFDVDTGADLARLERWLATAPPERARHVRAALAT